MKPHKNSPRPGRYQGGSDDFDICGQQEGHTIHGVPNDADDRAARRWDKADPRYDDDPRSDTY